MMTRRNFLLGLAGTAAAGAGGIGYSARVEPRWLDVSKVFIPLPKAVPGPPLRLLHLSDLHAGKWVPFPFIADAIRQGIALRPDVICITGDFLTAGQSCDDDVLVATLAPLAAAAPTFATLGNHDGGEFTASCFGERTPDRIGSVLARAGVTWLHNQRATLEVRGRKLHLIGHGDLWNGACRPEAAFRGFAAKPNELVVALSHNPDSKEFLLPHPWHVLLCGHTHGGQVGLPFLGRRFAPVRDKRFLAGLYSYAGRALHITRGIGTLHGVRVFCRPEISLLTI